MVTTIQIDERTKALLDKLKIHYRQSYNELIERLAKEKMKRKSILEFAGAWADMNDEEAEELKSSISNFRKEFNKNVIKRVKRYDLS
jgi:predicted CopG family antitoxin